MTRSNLRQCSPQAGAGIRKTAASMGIVEDGTRLRQIAAGHPLLALAER